MASRVSPNGSHLSAQATARGVSQGRKSREEALRRSEEYYRNFFDNAAMGIYQSTPDGKILTANRKLARLLGYSSPDELLDLNLAEDIYLDKHERQTLVAMHESTVGPIELEVEWKRRHARLGSSQLERHQG
ncbi:MAG: PAS domain S-box protein [Acidobacteriota bacterium]|nr:PAS domain S-box protein [Acidobacteriota bacterium]